MLNAGKFLADNLVGNIMKVFETIGGFGGDTDPQSGLQYVLFISLAEFKNVLPDTLSNTSEKDFVISL